MLIKKKLRDITLEEYKVWKNKICVGQLCNKCIFENTFCSCENHSWISHKDIYSDKFLDQEIEIEVTDILDEVEKKYLSRLIKPFRNRVINISKRETIYDSFEYIDIMLKNAEGITLPRFKENTMYKGMNVNKQYTLEELGL